MNGKLSRPQPVAPSQTAPPADPWLDLALDDVHVEKLEASAVSPEIAKARGYRSVWHELDDDTVEWAWRWLNASRYRSPYADEQWFGNALKHGWYGKHGARVQSPGAALLRALGFRGIRTQDVPGMLIPVWSPRGEIAYCQYRPDTPILDHKGKTRKYLAPRSQTMALDIHPSIRRAMVNPFGDLVVHITEGVIKADSMLSRGDAAIGFQGIWSWKQKDAKEISKPLPDWKRIPVKGRTILIVYDSDITTNPNVRTAAAALREMLEERRAKVEVAIVPPGAGGENRGIDDHNFAGGAPVGSLKRMALSDGERNRLDEVDAILMEEFSPSIAIVGLTVTELMRKERHTSILGGREWLSERSDQSVSTVQRAQRALVDRGIFTVSKDEWARKHPLRWSLK